MDLGLDGRTALVTGGGGRLGTAHGKRLAAEGAEVVLLDVDAEAAERVADEIAADGGEARADECDLTDREEVAATVEAVREDTGGVDVLVNNAGLVDAVSTVEEFPDELWDRDVAVNLTGTYNVTREVFPAMAERGWGRIITMSNLAGTGGGFGQL
ncbi:MAG: SDR family NAD(P)-dependent oxidoreductase, partial [Halobacteriales archaeon]